MSDETFPPAARNADPVEPLEREEDEAEYRRLESALELTTGFSLHLVVSDSFPVLLVTQGRLEQFERSHGHALRVIAPSSASEQREMVARLVSLERLAQETPQTPEARATVVLWPQLSSAEHSDTWRIICRLLNERREWFRHHWPHALCVFGSPEAYDTLREEGLDLWSIRSGTYTLQGTPSPSKVASALPSPSSPSTTTPVPQSTPTDQVTMDRADRLLSSALPGDRATGLQLLLSQAKKHLNAGDRNLVLTIAPRALHTARELDRQDLEAHALHLLSLAHFRERRLEEAEKARRSVIEISGTLKDRHHLATDYNEMSQIEKARGRLDSAEKWLRKAIGIDENLGDSPTLATLYNNMSTLDQARGRLDSAEKWLRKAIGIDEELGDRPNLAIDYNNMSQIEKARGRLDSAEKWLHKAIRINEELRDRPNLAIGYNNMSLIEKNRGRLDSAEKWLRKAIEIDEELGDRPNLAIDYNNISTLEQTRGRLESALAWQRRSWEMVDGQEGSMVHRTAARRLAKLLDDQGMAEEAEEIRRGLGEE